MSNPNMVLTIAANAVAVRQALAEMSSALKTAASDMQGKFKAVGAGATSVGMAMLPISAALAGAGVASLAFSGKFEESMTRLVSLAGVSAGELEGVKHHILDLAPAVGIGPQALAEAMTKVSSTVSDTSVAMSILDMAAKGSAAGMGSALDVAGALTAIVNSYGAANITAGQAADILTKAVQDGGAEAKELAPTLANVVPMAAQMGISFQEVAANIATFTKLGVPAAEAVTSLSSVMSGLLKETKDGSEALGSIGMSYDEVRAAIKERGLADTLADLTTKFGDNKTGLTDVFGRIEALRNVMGTAGQQAATYAEEIERMNAAAQEGTALDAAFNAMKGTQVQTFAELSAQVQVIAIKFGDVLAPALASLVDAAKPLLAATESLVKWFGELPAPLQTAAIGVGALVAVAGPALLAFGAMVSAIGAALPVLATVGTALATFVTGPIGLTVAAVVGLGLVWKTWGDDITRYVTEAYHAVKTYLWDKFEPVLRPIAGLLQSTGELFEAFRDLVGAVGLKVVGYVTTMVTDVGRWLYDKFKPVIDPAITLVKGISAVFEIVRDATVTASKAIYDGVKTYLVDKFTGIVDSVREKIDAVTGFFKSMADKVSLHSYVPEMVDRIGDAFGQLVAKMIVPSQEATGAVAQTFRELSPIVTDISTKLFDGLRGGWEGVRTAAQQGLQDIETYLEQTFVKHVLAQFGVVQAGGAAAFAGIGSSATSAYSSITSGTATTTTMTAASWSSWAGSVVGSIAIAFAAWKAFDWITRDKSPWLHNPSQPAPPGPEPGTPENPFPGEGTPWNPGTGSGTAFDAMLAYAQKLFDQAKLIGNDQTFQAYMYLHPELWGHGQGFARGTLGEYLDFGAGTPVVLHGRERVMTEAEGRQERNYIDTRSTMAARPGGATGGGGGGSDGGGSSGTVNVTIQALDARSFKEWLLSGGDRQIARAVFPHIPRVKHEYGIHRR